MRRRQPIPVYAEMSSINPVFLLPEALANRGEEIGLLEVSGGESEQLRLGEPSCATNDSTTLEVVIRGTDGRSSDPWTLERSGSW